MDRQGALDRLPPAYASALEMQERGLDGSVIAQALGLDPEAVANLLTLASAKLRRLLDDEEFGRGLPLASTPGAATPTPSRARRRTP